MSSLVFWGGDGWDNGTVWLYIGIGCLAGFLAFVSTRVKNSIYSVVCFMLATLSLILFKGLCVSGVDVSIGGGYYLNFQSAESISNFRDKSIEFGFQLFTVCIRFFTDSYGIYLLVVATVTVLPVMYVLWKIRDKINLSFGVMGFSLMFVVTGMSAMRQSMAVGLCLLAVYYFFVRRFKPFVVVLALATSIHVSSLCIILLILLALVQKRRIVQFAVAFLVLGLCVIGQMKFELLFTGRYAGYSVGDTSGSGVAALLKYAPIALLLLMVQNRVVKIRQKKSLGQTNFDMCWTVVVFSVCTGLVGYIVSILGRIESFSVPIIIVIAFLVRQCEQERYFRIPVKILLFGYFCFRFLLYMNDVYNVEGLMPYLTWL